MASSGKPTRASGGRGGLPAQVARQLSKVLKPGERVVLGLSGGIDSMVLLDVLVPLAARLPFELSALHVNHQLSPHAMQWARFCRAACRARGVPLRVVRVAVARGSSVERAAREARYAAFASAGAHVILAHNEDDQAETVLLQLLRGGGVKGLAAMPLVREPRQGRDDGACIIRPLLGVPRADIERYARAHRLAWIDDESNLDERFTRNWLRRVVMPALAARTPSCRRILARTARHMGEAGELLDALGRLDCEAAQTDGGLRVSALRTLPLARAKNALRFLIEAAGWRMPDAARLEEALRQALHATRDAQPAVDLGDVELRRHRDALYLVPRRRGAPPSEAVVWHGETELVLPGDCGLLAMTAAVGAGLSALRLAQAPVTIRWRCGGEKLQAHARGPQRTVKNLLQEAGVPPWQRARLPLVYCGEQLVCIPGIAVDARFAARPGERSFEPLWRIST